MICGWLFDVYPLDDKIILWIKNKNIHRLEVKWGPSLYVTSDAKYKLDKLQKNQQVLSLIKEYKWVNKTEKVSDLKESTVLKFTLKNSSDLLRLGKTIEDLDRFGVYRLYNVDIQPAQSFMYQYNLFPLGKYKIHNTWIPQSDIAETDYDLPIFTKINLQVNAKTSKKIPKFEDTIKSIQINNVTLQSDSEEQIILDCVAMIKDIDPDFIITQKGDTWDFPYLAYRASKNNISEKLVLGREDHPLRIPKRNGTSYYSYGQIHFKPTSALLQGRIHIDRSNAFLWETENSLQAIFEIARTCRLPIQTAARASIGKCMSSVQFYNATKRNLLIPWKPTVSEIFKTRMDLLIGDRGGLILEPRIGVHENVGEVDFASLFGNIMLQKNISAETINCECCPDSTSIVPDLQYHICKRQGIVPQSLRILLEKRKKYTTLIETTPNKEQSKIYEQRKAALKWILVTSFGYLGFNNAKFGRIDAHMAVCAFARKLLLQAMKIAEEHKFIVLHGIVDSLWIYKKNSTIHDYEILRDTIAKETGFDLSLDVYNWIVFLPSKNNSGLPVANRYFGANKNGELKLRGIETRRRDTPKFFKQCQLDILNLFAKCKNISEIKESMQEAKSIQNQYKMSLFRHKIPLQDLAFTNKVTRGTGQHKSRTIQADAVNQLKWEGKHIEPGQKIRYVISDYNRKMSHRVVPIEFADKYDAKKYSELLDDCCKSILESFEN
ncbi:MAG TPA: DNA polymerase domain-containing protein [Nitrosopumilaceae archaeon]|nr:DNA polymerase domain-containing protein [Nitrosopumilaceae archaeon]